MTHHVVDASLSSRPIILVVEDDALLRFMTADFLRDCGLRVLEAANADEAVGLLQTTSQICAVFTDIQMPGTMDGLGLARWISSERPKIRVLLTSGNAKVLGR